MENNKKYSEAEATVRKKNGKYYDFMEESLVSKGVDRLTDKEFMNLMGKLRLRFTLTPQCNSWCIFCSGEGLDFESRKNRPINIDYVIKLSDILLKTTPLKSIDFTGGEPTLHPDFVKGDYKLIRWIRKHPDIRFALHSNGISLNENIIDNIKDCFSRIGISIHSVNYETWKKITNLNCFFSENHQRKKFNDLMKNIDYLARQNISEKVFLKSVVVRGFNDSRKELKDFLEFCSKYGFHPKFFQFEPQFPEQKNFVVDRKEFFNTLESVGCKFSKDAPRNNNPNEYIPNTTFEYKSDNGTLIGLHSIFGCGDKAACESCYMYLCMFVKPTDDGSGLYLRPCAPIDTRFDLTWALKKNDTDQIVKLFKLSREYLMLAPGKDINDWNKKSKYKEDFFKINNC